MITYPVVQHESISCVPPPQIKVSPPQWPPKWKLQNRHCRENPPSRPQCQRFVKLTADTNPCNPKRPTRRGPDLNRSTYGSKWVLSVGVGLLGQPATGPKAFFINLSGDCWSGTFYKAEWLIFPRCHVNIAVKQRTRHSIKVIFSQIRVRPI